MSDHVYIVHRALSMAPWRFWPTAVHRSELHLFNPYKFYFSSLLLAMNVCGVA
jgi:hypothetical protein